MKQIPGKQWDNRKVPLGLFQPSYVAGFVGKTGSGKSTALLNMLQEYQKSNTFDKFILFSPSSEDDPKYRVIDWDQIYSRYQEGRFKQIIAQQIDDMKEWKEYQKKKEVYDKFIKNGQSLGGFTNTEKKILFGMIGGEGIIEKPFATMEREPYICVVFDDLGSSSAYSNNTSNFMNAMACRCRHKNITMIHATQHVYQIPRALRQQCSIMALFKTKDHKLLREIAKENSSDVNEDEFISLFEKATEDPHCFLLCDFLNENFRKNFDNLLLL